MRVGENQGKRCMVREIIEGIMSSISAITRYIKDHYYGDNKFVLLGRHPLLLDYER